MHEGRNLFHALLPVQGRGLKPESQNCFHHSQMLALSWRVGLYRRLLGVKPLGLEARPSSGTTFAQCGLQRDSRPGSLCGNGVQGGLGYRAAAFGMTYGEPVRPNFGRHPGRTHTLDAGFFRRRASRARTRARVGRFTDRFIDRFTDRFGCHFWHRWWCHFWHRW